MGKFVVLQHADAEKPGIIADALASHGHSTQPILTFKGEQVPPDLEGVQGVVIMGGPMSVYEQRQYPFLKDEIRLVEKALRVGKPVLGVCLGSQLLAASLGSKVRKGQKEIGWYPVTLTEHAAEDPLLKNIERSFMACHWHGDIFDLPGGAARLAGSSLTDCQAFRYGQNAYGFLFHMEMTYEVLQAMARTFADELKEEGIEGEEIVRQGEEYLPDLQKVGNIIFERWAELPDNV